MRSIIASSSSRHFQKMETKAEQGMTSANWIWDMPSEDHTYIQEDMEPFTMPDWDHFAWQWKNQGISILHKLLPWPKKHQFSKISTNRGINLDFQGFSDVYHRQDRSKECLLRNLTVLLVNTWWTFGVKLERRVKLQWFIRCYKGWKLYTKWGMSTETLNWTTSWSRRMKSI